ncbi:helix-turn-helix domain-containing protein [Ornithinimicrobium ciconiae]
MPRIANVGVMSEVVTPKQLAEELGVSDRTIRQWLRNQGWQSVPYTRWQLTAEQAARVRAHFRP